MNEIKRIATGYFVAYRDGVAVGCIASEHGDGAIAQHSSRMYEAHLHYLDKHVKHRGSLRVCKRWMDEMMDFLWGTRE